MNQEKKYTQNELDKTMDIFDILNGFDYDFNFEKKGGIYFNNELLKTDEEFIEKVFTAIPSSVRYEIIKSVLNKRYKENASELFKEKAANELKLWSPFSHNFNLKLLTGFKKFEKVFLGSLYENHPNLYRRIFKEDINRVWEDLKISLKESETPENIAFIIKSRFYYNVKTICPMHIDKIKDDLKEKTIWDLINKKELIENNDLQSEVSSLNKYIIKSLGVFFVDSNDNFFLHLIDEIKEPNDLNEDQLYGVSLLLVYLVKSIAFCEHMRNEDTDYKNLIKINNRYQDYYELKGLWNEIIEFDTKDSGIVINFNKLETLRYLHVRQEGVDLICKLNQQNKQKIYDLLVFGTSNGKDNNLNGINGFLDIIKDVLVDEGISCLKSHEDVNFSLYLPEIVKITSEKQNEIKSLIINLLRKVNIPFFNDIDTFNVEMKNVKNRADFEDMYEKISSELLPSILNLQMKSDLKEADVGKVKVKIKKF